jgi:hypothetical protein
MQKIWVIVLLVFIFLSLTLVIAKSDKNDNGVTGVLNKILQKLSIIAEKNNTQVTINPHISVNPPNITVSPSPVTIVKDDLPLRGRIVLVDPMMAMSSTRYSDSKQVVAMPKAKCNVTFYARGSSGFNEYTISEAASAQEIRNTLKCYNNEFCSGEFDFTDEYYLLLISPTYVDAQYYTMQLAYNC